MSIPLLLSPAPADDHLLVSEIFGPTVQGEGPSCGRQAMFVRLADCNLACWWCDTPYAWRWRDFDRGRETRQRAVASVLAELAVSDVPLVVITGGEPLIQADGVTELAAGLAATGRSVEVETNGTFVPPADLAAVARFNVSPKLTNSGMRAARRIDLAALRAFVSCGRAVFKFVVTGRIDLDEVAELVDAYGLSPVWIMPEGRTAERVVAVTEEIADVVVARGWNLTTRLHVLAWGDRRGH